MCEVIDIAVAEHVALHHELYFGILFDALFLYDFEFEVGEEDGDFVIERDGYGIFDLMWVKIFWNVYFGVDSWFVVDFYYGIIECFLECVVFEDLEGFEFLWGRSVLYVVNY